MFGTPPGTAETGCGLGCEWRSGGLTAHCRWAMPAHKALFLGGTGGVYSLGFVLSKEVQWYF